MIDSLCDAEKMFPAPPPGLECFKGPEGPHRQEYMKLMLRELLSGKTELRDSFRGGGTILAVGKDGGRQRAVWDGSRVTQVAGKQLNHPTSRRRRRYRMWRSAAGRGSSCGSETANVFLTSSLSLRI
jgi:hypothetical protein